MEELVGSGLVAGVLDLTTTELADELVGGVLSAGPHRLEAAGRRGIPQVVSLGALDMVNFGPRETVPAASRTARCYVHNPSVTLMRTTPDECAELGRRLAGKLSRRHRAGGRLRAAAGGVRPLGRGRAVPRPARRTRHCSRRCGSSLAPHVERHELDTDVNDPEFAAAMAARLDTIHGRPAVNGDQARQRLRATLADGGTIIGAGAGTGLSAKCAEAGGADLIIIYNSGRYRMAGRGSLAGLMPYGDANAIVMEMAGEVLPVVRETPVLAGVCGTDPFRLMDRFLDEVAAAGFAGVQNFPTVGLIDGVFRANLEETGMSYAQEVEMIGLAAERGLLTAPVRLRRRVGRGHDAGRRRRARPAHGADDQGEHRRPDGPHARRLRGARPGRCATPRSPSTPTSSCCATAARSPSPTTPSTCSTGPAGSSGSSAPPAWSACRPRSP